MSLQRQQLPTRLSRGRPRDPAVESAVRQATLQLLEEEGYSGMTISAVAARAGVAKPSIYLRWPSKVCLVVDTIAEVMDTSPFPDTGNLRQDLLAGLKKMIHNLTQTAVGRILGGLLAELQKYPELAISFRQRYFQPRWRSLEQALRRAQARGELQGGVDPALVTDSLLGPIYYRLLVRAEPLCFEVETQVVDLVLVGLQAGHCNPIAGFLAFASRQQKEHVMRSSEIAGFGLG